MVPGCLAKTRINDLWVYAMLDIRTPDLRLGWSETMLVVATRTSSELRSWVLILTSLGTLGWTSSDGIEAVS